MASHDCYLRWLQQDGRSDEVNQKFMRNLKSWLCGDPDLAESKIAELGELVSSGRAFNEYALIKWSHTYEANERVQQRVLDFVQNGGALMCASTPWGFLQVYPDKTLQDMVLHNFLKNFMGVLFTSACLWLPGDTTDVASNRAKHSHFDMALEKVSASPKKIGKYLGTINCGLDQLKREQMLSNEKILDLKDMIMIECDTVGWSPVPNAAKPIRDEEVKNVAKLLGHCMAITEGAV